MARLPVLSGSEMVKVLEKSGFLVVRQRGSHIVLQKRSSSATITAVVPNHKELAPGTLRSILKRSGLSLNDLLNLLSVLIGITQHFW